MEFAIRFHQSACEFIQVKKGKDTGLVLAKLIPSDSHSLQDVRKCTYHTKVCLLHPSACEFIQVKKSKDTALVL